MEKKKILIVEDEVTLVEILSEQFRGAGFEVGTAKDGVEGLAAATKSLPDVVLIDILMPKMDGITMLKKMREIPALSKVPCIILTNLNDNQSIQQALESGAYDFLIKSDWDPKDLVKRIKEKLSV